MSRGFYSFRRSAVPAVLMGLGIVTLSLGNVRGGDAVPSTSGAGDAATSGFSAVSESDSEAASETVRRFKLPDRPNTMGDLFNRQPSHPVQMPAPRPTPVRRQRSILDEPGNWGFATAEDVVQEYMSKHVTKIPEYGPDGRDLDSMSPVERYYERQMRGRAIKPSSTPQTERSNFDLDRGVDRLEVRSIDGITGYGNQSLRENLVRPDALPDLLRMRDTSFSPEAIREREAILHQTEAFRRALDVRPAAGVSSVPTQSIDSQQGFGRNRNSNTSGSFAPMLPRNPYDSMAGTYNPYVAVAAPTAPSAPIAPSAPGQSSLETTFFPATSRVTPPKPDFSIPQRRF
jgi:hypothetical protein